MRLILPFVITIASATLGYSLDSHALLTPPVAWLLGTITGILVTMISGMVP